MSIHETTQTTLTIFADDQLVVRTKPGKHGADADLIELFPDYYNKNLRFVSAVQEEVEVQEGVYFFEVGMQWTQYNPTKHVLFRVVKRTRNTFTLQCWIDGMDQGTRRFKVGGESGEVEYYIPPTTTPWNECDRPKWKVNFAMFPFHAVISGATDTVFAEGGE